ncbi:MAG TPA: MgtC/SapB family protein [Candidatus Avipropionibacterium avicola]|uniref:MgtC/SapB family protein n=1 Tax=Candidatus Avipropionibacterium avicola TaxID=2840701 RepID=A0A9D1KLT1_9ACTN|nr:MgtC/SapB family protein [Candidatus Avipropionibacterium avicola]
MVVVQEIDPWLMQIEHLPELGVALVLSLLIGLERQLRGKEAGVRTHALVGLGSALFMLVSKFGFMDLVAVQNISIDPSRVAAQIVSGIGFLGAGIIVFRADAVRGLTTAAAVWLTAAVGMASGAGLFLLAAIATVGHFVVVFVGPLLKRASRKGNAELGVEYRDGQGLLRDIVAEITRGDWNISGIRTTDEAEPGYVEVSITAQGAGAADELVKVVSDMEGVRSVDLRATSAKRRLRLKH